MATMLDAIINLKDNFSDTLKQVEKNIGGFSRTASNMGKDVQNAGRNVGKVGGALTKSLTMPLIGAGIAAAKIGMDFEESMSNVKAMSGASGEEMVRLEKAARDAGAATSKSAKESADALGYMALAGWDVETSMKGLMPVLRLSEAGNIDLARASSLVTDSMSAMGIEVKDLPKYLDIVAQTARSSNTDIDQMMESYLGVGGVLRGLNVPLEDSSVALGMLANAGIKGSESGKSLSSILTNLTAPTGRAKKALDELGFSAFDSNGDFKGMEDVLFDLQGKMKGMTTEQKNSYMSMIAGKEHIKGLNALMNGLDDSYVDLKSSVKGADGALDEMSKTMLDNNKGSLTQMKSGLEEVGLKIYDVLKPAISDAIELGQKFTDTLNNLTPEQQEMITKFVKMAVVIGPVLMIIGNLTSRVGGAMRTFGKFAGVVKKLGLKGAILTPGVQVVAVIALLAAGAFLIYKNWDKLKEVFLKVKNSVLDFAGISSKHIEGVKEIFKSLGATMREKMQEVAEKIAPLKDKFGELFSKLGELFNKIMPILMPIVAFIGGVFIAQIVLAFMTFFNIVMVVVEGVAGHIDAMITIFMGFIDFFVGVFTGDWDMAWEGIKTIFTGSMDMLSNAWEVFVGLITAPVDALIDILDGAFHDKMDGIKKAWEGLKEFFKHPIKGTVNAVKQGAGWVADKVGNNFSGTNNWRGGPTWVHEKGAEIIDLPKGSRVYPHDKSLEMARQQGMEQSRIKNMVPSIKTLQMPKVPDIVQSVRQKLVEVDIPKVPDVNYNIKSNIEREQMPKIPNIVQTIKQKLASVNVPKISDTTQNIKQNLIKSDIPKVPDTGYNISQNIKREQMPKIADVVQTVKQKLASINIPKISDMTQTIKQKLSPATIEPLKRDVISTSAKKKDVKVGEKDGRRKFEINIPKLADQIIVREEADIDKIADALFRRVEKARFNMG